MAKFQKISKPKRNLYAVRLDDELAYLIENERKSLNLPKADFLERVLRYYFDYQKSTVVKTEANLPNGYREITPVVPKLRTFLKL